jgi:hypothetical protein
MVAEMATAQFNFLQEGEAQVQGQQTEDLASVQDNLAQRVGGNADIQAALW